MVLISIYRSYRYCLKYGHLKIYLQNKSERKYLQEEEHENLKRNSSPVKSANQKPPSKEFKEQLKLESELELQEAKKTKKLAPKRKNIKNKNNN